MAVLEILGHMPKYGNLVPRLHIFSFFYSLIFLSLYASHKTYMSLYWCSKCNFMTNIPIFAMAFYFWPSKCRIWGRIFSRPWVCLCLMCFDLLFILLYFGVYLYYCYF